MIIGKDEVLDRVKGQNAIMEKIKDARQYAKYQNRSWVAYQLN